MYREKIHHVSQCQWRLEPQDDMNVPVVVFGDKTILEQIDENTYRQAVNVARLPGIVSASYIMPDAHLGYGFPIGGVAAFDPTKGGVISAGGVGFDISCGVRALQTGLKIGDIEKHTQNLAEALFRKIPAGVGSGGKLKLSEYELDEMLVGGAAWAVENGYGSPKDLRRIEEDGRIGSAKPDYVSGQAKNRQTDQVGTLGSGNHYLEVQKVTEIYDRAIADAYGLAKDDIMVTIHCGSRGLGHQIATDYLPQMVKTAKENGIELAERELACAPIDSEVGKKYFGAMNAGINCALANRQVLTHLVRKVFKSFFAESVLEVLYDVSHNTCKVETHTVNSQSKQLYVHRKGATRAFGPGHPSLPSEFKSVGQPVLIGGTMGTASYILAGTEQAMQLSFGSCCHGAGRAMSRTAAKKRWHGKDIVRHLAEKKIIIKGASTRGIAEEAPNAYKDIDTVVNSTEKAGLAKKVVRLEPMMCITG